MMAGHSGPLCASLGGTYDGLHHLLAISDTKDPRDHRNENLMSISFMPARRVKDDGNVCHRTPAYPSKADCRPRLIDVPQIWVDYLYTLSGLTGVSGTVRTRGGVLLPMDRQDAMWMSFRATG